MNNKKKNTKLVLLVLLVCITLGYAALRTGLNINGTANVSGSSWNVHFANYQNSQNTNITPTTEPSISGTTTTSISYEVDLEAPGDLYEFTVDIVNGGSLDALISLVSTYNGDEIDNEHPVPAYITYSVTDENGDAIVNDHQLDGGDSETVKVYIKYRDDDPSVLPNNDNNGLGFDLEIVARQAPKTTPSTLRTVYTGGYGNWVYLNQEIPVGLPTFSTPAAVRAEYNNYLVYLKHELDENNIVRESDVEFVIDNEVKQAIIDDVCSDDSECEAEVNSLVNGTYTLRGYFAADLYEDEYHTVCKDEYYNTETNDCENPYYESNKNAFKTAFNYENYNSRCGETASGSFGCQLDRTTGGLNGSIDADGFAILNMWYGYCEVDYDGLSLCYY